MYEIGNRVYMLKGRSAGKLGTVIAIDESSEIPLLIEPDDGSQRAQWNTPEELTTPHPSHKPWHRTHYRP